MLTPHYEVYEPIPGKRKLTVKFDVEQGEILSTFLVYDVVASAEKFAPYFDRVLLGSETCQEFSGNACHVIVEPKNTTIYDQMYDDDTCCVVNTRELYIAMLEWCDKLRDFRFSCG